MDQLYTCVGVSPVEDLQFHFTSNNLLCITWSPPVYFSNDIPIGSIFGYNILVTDENANDEEQPIIVDTTIRDTFFEVDSITNCDTFNIDVTAVLAQHTSNNNTERNTGSK